MKQFSPMELAVRIGAVLRQRSGIGYVGQRENYVLEDLVISYGERRVAAAGRPVVLTATAYALLFEPLTNADLEVTHGQLLQRIWGPGNDGDAGLARTVLQRLRRKFGDDAHSPRYIFIEPRVVYRMEKPSST